jgi:hypothetical protein
MDFPGGQFPLPAVGEELGTAAPGDRHQQRLSQRTALLTMPINEACCRIFAFCGYMVAVFKSLC